MTFDESEALALDAADPLAPYRERFHVPEPDGRPVVYLCGNSLGLQPKTARAIVEQELDDWRDLAVGAHFDGVRPWFPYHEQFRESGARVVGARPGEVVMMNGLTVNLHLLMVSFYRPTPARHRILIEASAFPSDRYAVASQVAFHGFDPEEGVLVARPRDGEAVLRDEDLDALLDEHGDSIALVLIGGVQYYTGQLFDLGRVAEKARALGCVVGFDLAHAAGNVPLRLHEWGVDFAAWCTYKYLNAGPGSVAGAFVHERHAADASRPRFAGWWGNDPATRFSIPRTFVPRAGADGWQLSNPPILSMAPLVASLAIFDEVGMETLRAKSIALTGYLERCLDTIPGERFDVITPREPERRGCQLSIRVREGARELHAALGAARVVCDYREPDVIRVAPVPLYNSFHDVWQFVSILGSAAGRP